MIVLYAVDYELADSALPLGVVTTVLVDGRLERITFVADPQPYLLVVEPRTGEPPTPERTRELDVVRHIVARMSGRASSPTLPKLGIVGEAGPHGDVSFRTRIAEGAAWHPKVASSGLLALGGALGVRGTVASAVAVLDRRLVVETPAGLRPIEMVLDSGRPRLRIWVEVDECSIHVLGEDASDAGAEW